MSSANPVATIWPYIERTVMQLLRALEGLDEHEINWKPLSTANSLYVIVNHVMGNVEENFLEVLGGQNVHRERESEFAASGQTAELLAKRWEQLRVKVDALVAQLPESAAQERFYHPRRGALSGLDVMIVMARHAAEHAGEAGLTRDLILARRKETGQTK